MGKIASLLSVAVLFLFGCESKQEAVWRAENAYTKALNAALTVINASFKAKKLRGDGESYKSIDSLAKEASKYARIAEAAASEARKASEKDVAIRCADLAEAAQAKADSIVFRVNIAIVIMEGGTKRK